MAPAAGAAAAIAARQQGFDAYVVCPEAMALAPDISAFRDGLLANAVGSVGLYALASDQA
jgi:hypothetical protein